MDTPGAEPQSFGVLAANAIETVIAGLRGRAARLRFLLGETAKLWTGAAPHEASREGSALTSPGAADEPQNLAPPPARTPLQEWRALARRTFITVAAFSVFVNLLMLTVPIYLFQISDRVLTSRSIDTLLMLSMLAVAFLAVLSLLDICRRQVLGALANRLETILGGHLLASVISNAAGRQAHLPRPCAACITCATSSPAPSCCCCSMRRWRRSISRPCSSSARSSASSR